MDLRTSHGPEDRRIPLDGLFYLTQPEVTTIISVI